MLPSSNLRNALALAGLLGLLGLLAGCSEYLDRREQIGIMAGNAVFTDRMTQMVDPWPRASANRDIAFNGDRIETAVERYRTNRVIQPKGIGTSTAYDPGAAAPAANNAAPGGPPATLPAAPVK